jgi:hypothetical protein
MEDVMARLISLVVFTLLFATSVYGQQQSTKAAKIDDAVSAAPPSISAHATILDWPAKEGGEMAVLREGTNGWTCFPDMPGKTGSAMCIDAPWLEWADAWMNKREPNITGIGFGYMLQDQSGFGDSNTDPYATERTEDNEWMEHGVPHLMILVPGDEALAGLPTDPHNGGPWVMWRNSPYAHIMAPMPEYVPQKGSSSR